MEDMYERDMHAEPEQLIVQNFIYTRVTRFLNAGRDFHLWSDISKVISILTFKSFYSYFAFLVVLFCISKVVDSLRFVRFQEEMAEMTMKKERRQDKEEKNRTLNSSTRWIAECELLVAHPAQTVTYLSVRIEEGRLAHKDSGTCE